MKLLFTEWLNKIDEHFEKEFWIDENNSDQFVNIKFIYKDTVDSSFKWTDYQLRLNFLVAAVVVILLYFNHLKYFLFNRVLKIIWVIQILK